MARDDFRSRKERREEEDRKEAAFKEKQDPSQHPRSPKVGNSSQELDELIHEAQMLIEQLNTLYQGYASGREKRPPIEKRARLDQIMNTIQKSPKATPALSFKAGTLGASYMTHRERWEKTLEGRG